MVSGNKIPMKNIVSWLKAGLFATALITSSFAHASYPDKPIRIIVTFVAGGGADVLARYMAKEMAEVLGQPVVVENRTGAGGLIGVEAGLAAAPDGYTLTLISSSYTVNPSLYKLKFDPLKDITPVVRVSAGPMLAVTSTKSGIKTVPELIAAAKKAPGAINFASSGQGSVIHLANELFNQRADIKMTHIPYKGGGNALVDLIANQVDLYFAATASALPHVRTGKINAVAVTTPDRIAQFEKDLVQAVKQAEKPDAKLAVGDHCRWCAAKPVCPKMTGAADRALKVQIEALPAPQISDYLKTADMLEDWIKDLRALALQMLESGAKLPEYKLVAKRAIRSWSDEEKAKIALFAYGLTESEVMETSVVSPAKAEKALKKRKIGLPEDLVVAISSGNTLASADDPRPEVMLLSVHLRDALSKLQ
jgi:tripartite-type tricarboxylate transporter receptor subunit TctC